MIYVVEDMIQKWDLLDFKPRKGLYTWTNNRIGEDHISARLDRFLVQSTMLMERRLISLAILPKLTSDHKPIQLMLEEEENLGPIPFRFSPLWNGKSGFAKNGPTSMVHLSQWLPQLCMGTKIKNNKKGPQGME